MCSSSRGGEVYIGGTTAIYEPIDIAAAYTDCGGSHMYQYNELVPYMYDAGCQFGNPIDSVYVSGDGYKVNSGTYDTAPRSVSYSVNGVYNKVGGTDHYRPSHTSDAARKDDSLTGYQVDHHADLHRTSWKKDYDTHSSGGHRSSGHGSFGSQNRDKMYHERNLDVSFDRYDDEERSSRFLGSHEHFGDYTDYDRAQEKVRSPLGNYTKTYKHSCSPGDVAYRYSDRYVVRVSRREREKSYHGGSDRSYRHGGNARGHKRSRSSVKINSRNYYGTDLSDSDEKARHRRLSTELEEWVQRRGGYSRNEAHHSSASVGGPRTIPVIQSRY